MALLAQSMGAERTEQYVNDLIEVFQLLSDSPKIGTGCDNIRSGYRKYSINRHAVYYSQTVYGVKIIRILHGRMKPTRHF